MKFFRRKPQSRCGIGPSGDAGGESECGRLRHGEGTRGRGARRRRVQELPRLSTSTVE